MTSLLREANPVPRPPPPSPSLVAVFAGLMLGTFLGAVNQTAGKEVLAELDQAGADDPGPVLGTP